MNSMSRGYYEPCRKDEYQKKYYREEEESCPTIIKCGCPASTQIPPVTVATGVATTTLTIASLTLDTSCICDPDIKLDFTTNLVIGLGVALGSISLQVFKQCNGNTVPIRVGSAWTISGGLIAASTANTFSFFTCDSDSCTNGCCTYSVVATVTATALVIALGASFNNSTLAATVTCKNRCHKCRRD